MAESDVRLTVNRHAYLSYSIIGDRRTTPGCRVYWGSHGCDLDRGHAGPCECSCCDCPDGRHDGITAPTLIDNDNVICVARAPYYGPDTRFYGEDVEARGLLGPEG